MTLRGHVTNGRIVVDEPTDLPEGTELVLEVSSPLDVIAYIERMPPYEIQQTERLLERDRVYGLQRAPDEK